jgi:hypothetical protein
MEGYAARPCSVVAGTDCEAPANGTRSTRGTCYSCGEPVCLSPWCSRIRPWPRRRARICRVCDERQGFYADPAALVEYDRALAAATGDQPSWL